MEGLILTYYQVRLVAMLLDVSSVAWTRGLSLIQLLGF